MSKFNLILDKLIWLFTTILFSSFYIFNTNEYSRFILLGITLIILGLEFLYYGKKFPLYWHTFHTLMLLFAIFCFASALWAIEPYPAIIQGSIILQLLICMSVLYTYYLNSDSTTPLWDIIMWSGYIVTVYAFLYYGLDTIKNILSYAERLDNAFANVNDIGMLAALSVTITLYDILFKKFKWYHLLAILNIILIAATGSRKALFLLIAGTALITFLRYSAKNFFLSLFHYIILFCLCLVLFRLLLEISIFEGVKERFDTMFNMWRNLGKVDSSAFLRSWMIQVGWEQFKQTPIIGVGMSNSGIILERVIRRTYFHNNYIEMLACGGIVGTVLYYQLFLIPAIQLFRQRFCPDKNTMLCLILIMLIFMMDMGAVSSGAKSTYFYLMIIFIQVKINKRFLDKQNKETYLK